MFAESLRTLVESTLNGKVMGGYNCILSEPLGVAEIPDDSVNAIYFWVALTTCEHVSLLAREIKKTQGFEIHFVGKPKNYEASDENEKFKNAAIAASKIKVDIENAIYQLRSNLNGIEAIYIDNSHRASDVWSADRFWGALEGRAVWREKR